MTRREKKQERKARLRKRREERRLKKKQRKHQPQPIHNKHHRKPRYLGGTSEPRNISVVKISEHRAWHHLFRTMTPQQIASRINRLWLDPDWKMEAVRKDT